MTSRGASGGGCNYEILVVLAATLIDLGAGSPTAVAPAPSSDGASSGRDNSLATSRHSGTPSTSARLLVDSDMIMQLATRNVENLPEPLQGPAMFVMGFSQQNVKNLMSTMRSLGQMLISSLVMMAVKRLFFADLKTEADRNKASGLTDAILNIVNVLDF